MAFQFTPIQETSKMAAPYFEDAAKLAHNVTPETEFNECLGVAK